MKVAQKWWMNRIFRFQLILKGLNGSHQEAIESCFLPKKFYSLQDKLPNNCQPLRKLHFPTTKNRWEKPGAKSWTLLGLPNLSCQHEPPGKAQLLYIPGGDHGISQSTAFFNFYSFLTQSYVVIWWGHWAVSISSISQAENVPNENPLILRTTVHLPCTYVYLRLPLQNCPIWVYDHSQQPEKTCSAISSIDTWNPLYFNLEPTNIPHKPAVFVKLSPITVFGL